MEYPWHDRLCVFLCDFWRWILCHTGHTDMDFTQCYCSCVSSAGSLRWIPWLPDYMDIIIHSMTLGGFWRWIPCHTEHIDMNSPPYESSCVSFGSLWKLIPCHTEHSFVDSPRNESLCVYLCGSWRWIPCHREYSVYLCSSMWWNTYHTEHSDMYSP